MYFHKANVILEFATLCVNDLSESPLVHPALNGTKNSNRFFQPYHKKFGLDNALANISRQTYIRKKQYKYTT